MANTWTLCYEEQFYLVTGLLLAFASRRFFSAAAIVTRRCHLYPARAARGWLAARRLFLRWPLGHVRGWDSDLPLSELPNGPAAVVDLCRPGSGNAVRSCGPNPEHRPSPEAPGRIHLHCIVLWTPVDSVASLGQRDLRTLVDRPILLVRQTIVQHLSDSLSARGGRIQRFGTLGVDQRTECRDHRRAGESVINSADRMVVSRDSREPVPELVSIGVRCEITNFESPDPPRTSRGEPVNKSSL